MQYIDQLKKHCIQSKVFMVYLILYIFKYLEVKRKCFNDSLFTAVFYGTILSISLLVERAMIRGGKFEIFQQ